MRRFTAQLKERCLGADVIGGLNPGQQVVKLVGDELEELMGGESAELSFAARPPTVILMVGLQGSGKTTAAAKLARYLHEERRSSVALAACDVYRPAAVEQLVRSVRKPAPRSTSRAPTAIRSRSLAGRSSVRRRRARTFSSSTRPGAST